MRTRVVSTTMKQCTCCSKVYTKEEMLLLSFVGVQDTLLLFNCDCDSTIAFPDEIRRPTKWDQE